MNDAVEKVSYIKQIKSYAINNLKIIIGSLFVLILIFGIFQFYIFSKNKNILNSSILYDSIIFDNTSSIYQEELIKLSKEGNFYGILSKLENIKYKLEKNLLEDSYSDYIDLLENSNLPKIYLSAIAIQGSYNFLNKLYIKDGDGTSWKKNNEILIYSYIKNLLTYIDVLVDSYTGPKLEILYLIEISKSDINKQITNEKIDIIYSDILDNISISSTIKERVKKIHEFKKYK